MGVRRSPGALESAVMRVLWDTGRPVTANEVREAFGTGPDTPAFTTLITVLNRLHTKCRVTKVMSADGNYVFAAAESEPTHAARTMMAALVATSDRGAALLQFAGTLDEQDVEVLRQALRGAHDPRTAG